MSERIIPGGVSGSASESGPQRRFVPLKVGNATVYVEYAGDVGEVEVDDRIYPVAPPTPQEAFETAGEVLHECVRVVGERMDSLAERAKPQEVTVEFTLTFEGSLNSSVIPILVTAGTKASTGLRVTAVWRRPEVEEG